MEDKMFIAAKYYYDFLLNRDFHLIAGNRKRERIEFDVLFREEHFKHLIGFSKLKDIPESQIFGYNLLENILNKKITYQYISKSIFFPEMENRLDSFMLIKETLFTKKIMLGKTDSKSFNTIQANFLLTKDCEFGLVNLFLKEKSPGLVVPVTFFTTANLKYLNTTKWTIISIFEITK